MSRTACAAAAMILGVPAVAAAALAFGGPYLLTVLLLFMLAYVLAQSFDWVGGELGYINLGHCVFFGIGGYGFARLLDATASWPLALAGAGLLGAAAALALAVPLFRLRGDYFAFGTLALVPLAEILANNLSDLTGGSGGLTLPPNDVLRLVFVLAAVGVVLAFAITCWLKRSRFGAGLRAIRNDEQAASTIGVRALPLKGAVFALSAVMAAMTGAVQTWYLGFIDPPTVFGLGVALAPVAMALLGGSGLLFGPLAGAVLISGLEQALTAQLSEFQLLAYGIVVILVGRFMPGGLLRGIARRRAAGVAVSGAGAAAPGTGLRPALPLTPRLDSTGTLLTIGGLHLAFGGNKALDGIDLTVSRGEIVGLVGANGSGKTTLFNCISRVHTPQAGHIHVAGRSLGGVNPAAIVKRGVGRTYQLPRPFSDLTVRENIAMALMYRAHALTPDDARDEAVAFASYVKLADRLDHPASTLSIQQRKALELARALAGDPELLLVDELAAGLTPAEIIDFTETMRDLRDRYGITIIWVEHVFSALARVVNRVVVLERGKVIADDAVDTVSRDARVLETYLGTGAGNAAGIPASVAVAAASAL